MIKALFLILQIICGICPSLPKGVETIRDFSSHSIRNGIGIDGGAIKPEIILPSPRSASTEKKSIFIDDYFAPHYFSVLNKMHG